MPLKKLIPDAPKQKASQVDAQGRRTYTYAEYHANTGGNQQRYRKYLDYVHNVRANVDKRKAVEEEDPANDPAFAPVPRKVGQAQAQQSGFRAFNPAIQQENASYAADQKRVGQTITNYTRGLAAFLGAQGGPGAMGTFNNVQSGIAASNAALGAGATGQAAEGQAGLAEYLARIGAPAESSQYAADIGARGQSVAGNIAAAGQAAYEGGAARQGSLGDYLATLPSIAAQGGRRTLADSLSGLASAHKESVGDLRSQMAKSIQDEFATFQDRELQKASARTTLSRYLSGDQTDLEIAAAKARAAKEAAVIKARAARDKEAAKAKQRKYVFRKDGSVWETGGPEGPVRVRPPGSAGTDTTTAGKSNQTQVNQATTKAVSIAKAASKVTTKTKTVEVPNPRSKYLPPVKKKVAEKHIEDSYYEAIEKVKAAVKNYLPGYTDEMLTAFAQQQVNPYYPPGKNGRPGKG